MDSELWKDVLNKIESEEKTVEEGSSIVLDQEIIDIYEKVALILSRYKSGKLPKAFKVIPNLKNWEQILELTRPDDWTPNAIHQATKIFVSTFTPKLAARYLTLILLPKIRHDFQANKKLNTHFYQSIMLSITKPSAFFTGILMPICLDNKTTQREAVILSSILKKMSIPVLYSAAAIIKLCALQYYGPRAIVMRSLIEKKYSLPQSAITSLLNFFDQSSCNPDNNAVLWQQLVLTFCVRYCIDLSSSEKSTLLLCSRRLPHESISFEIVDSIEKTQSILS